ncbi:BACON domain-containing protein [Polaribacter phage Leef_1]|uniref:BACON domain-containing protein n=1 Tax=Polaribacter phage Leef_1 TaxID=2745684 RepID=A0A8E4ZDC4_9CAUD|nr:BACON domain-containing protein [Polaribacter phage Leef_1]QQV91378.1 BACON domain-containing protein [Polaribacter phage Leef_1]
MADISVNPLNFTYKQFDSEPDSVVIRFSNLTSTNVSFGNLPSWLIDAPVLVVDATTVDVPFFLVTNAANQLSTGTYQGFVDVVSETDDNGITSYKNEGVINVYLYFTESIVLSVTPENIDFNIDTGADNPTGKIVQVFSENSWLVSSSNAWLTTSTTNGSNNGSFTVNVDATGLSDATNLGVITVDDGVSIKNINVSLLISDGNTPEDFLYLAPQELEFVKNIGSSYNPTKSISLSSSESWTATSSESWLVLNKLTGSSGSDVINISIDEGVLEAGTYAGEIALIAGNKIRKTFVKLFLSEILVEIPENGKLYFVEDNLRIRLSSENTTSFLEVDFKTTAKNKILQYSKKAPYVDGESYVEVGNECVDIIEADEIPETITSKVLTMLQPAVINCDVYEKDYFTASVFSNYKVNSLSFLNGYTPIVENKLTYIPNTITLSRKGVIALHTYKTVNPGNIYITGAITKTITVNEAAESNVYSCFVNLSEFNLSETDVIKINFDFLEINVRIREEASESIMLCFENEWQLPELFELTGAAAINGTGVYSTQEVQTSTNVHERIYQTESSKEFTVYTGFIESAEEVVWLNKILDTTKMFLFIDGKKIEVIPTFKTLPIYQTREHQKNFKLTFKNAKR